MARQRWQDKLTHKVVYINNYVSQEEYEEYERRQINGLLLLMEEGERIERMQKMKGAC